MKMEKKPYQWLLKLLSKKSDLRVLETMVCYDFKLSAIYFKDKNNGLGVSYLQVQTM
jgi:hypothetical protein